jgi:hypothetical protein
MFFAASSAPNTFTASRSPPNACPAVIVSAINPSSFRNLTVLLNAIGSEPPSVIT